MSGTGRPWPGVGLGLGEGLMGTCLPGAPGADLPGGGGADRVAPCGFALGMRGDGGLWRNKQNYVISSETDLPEKNQLKSQDNLNALVPANSDRPFDQIKVVL